MTRVVVAPDSFKGSLTASEVADALTEGLVAARPHIRVDRCPMADGGEGTLDVLLTARHGRRRRAIAHTPTGDLHEADLGLIDQASTAIVELATIAGLPLVPPAQRRPLELTTFGVGELIHAAIESQVERMILALGGSATIDGGCGLAQALGLKLLDRSGRVLPSPLPPARLGDVARIDANELIARTESVEFTVAVDVLNTLLGENGAARVFGPQKGADAEATALLETNLAHWADILEHAGGRPLRSEPGTGAAGGAAMPLLAFAPASIVPGVDLVIDAVRLADRIVGADLVITGEGKLDRQSMMGKVVGAVARLGRAAGVRCVAVVGTLGDDCDASAAGLDAVHVLARAGEDLAATIRQTPTRLREIASTILARI